MSFWCYYDYELMKRYVPDIVKKGSSSLWGARIGKGYGFLKYTPEYFDRDFISEKNIAEARKTRPIFYEQLLSPYEIKNALKYSPVVLDVDIYESIFSDVGGVVTMPDEEEQRLEMGHCFSVLGHTTEGLNVHAGNWIDWGENGHGFITYDYLKDNFVTAFSTIYYKFFGQQITNGYRRVFRRKIKIRNRKWSISTYQVGSVRDIKSKLFNIEIMDTGGILAAWMHLSIDSDKNVEILELFVLKEYRRLGLGSFLFSEVTQIGNKAKSLQCYISAHDLIGENEEHLIKFLLKNEYTVVSDRTHFKDARLRIHALSSI